MECTTCLNHSNIVADSRLTWSSRIYIVSPSAYIGKPPLPRFTPKHARSALGHRSVTNRGGDGQTQCKCVVGRPRLSGLLQANQ